MTSERRAEVNRRLAEFENGAQDPTRCPICFWPLAESADKGCVPGNCSMRPRPIHQRPDYTRDLNALSRLEGRLPWHEWHLYPGHAEMWGTADMLGDGFEPTEAEARAEVICQWLESRK